MIKLCREISQSSLSIREFVKFDGTNVDDLKKMAPSGFIAKNGKFQWDFSRDYCQCDIGDYLISGSNGLFTYSGNCFGLYYKEIMLCKHLKTSNTYEVLNYSAINSTNLPKKIVKIFLKFFGCSNLVDDDLVIYQKYGDPYLVFVRSKKEFNKKFTIL